MSAAHIQPLDQTPDLLSIAAALPRRYPFLLDSATAGPLGQYSLLLRSSGERLVLEPGGRLSGAGDARAFLDALEDRYRACATADAPDAALPFSGGWFVYLGYELAAEIEPTLELPAARDGLPVAMAERCPAAVVIRHGGPGGNRAWLVAETREMVEEMRAELWGMEVRPPTSMPGLDCLDAEPARRFEEAVERIQRYIEAGDVFQVNLSRGWRGRFAAAADPFELYRRLRHNNPAPFAGLAHMAGRFLISSSPERLVETRARCVQTRPIAGTYPRGRDRASDRALSRDLLAHPKERAEHVMLIDLERNDLGRVCHAGSIEVNEFMVVESYTHVHHIVSNVRGVLREDMTPVDAIRAVFPGGTITGCPKIRCMQIIAELERAGRGFYTGAMGYLSRDGRMDLNILIRSMLLADREILFRTGAGIVADSVAQREVAETEAKAKGLLAALA